MAIDAETMHASSFAVENLGPLLGVFGGIVGLAVQGWESGVLWCLVGYFLGKSMQSTYWTLAAE